MISTYSNRRHRQAVAAFFFLLGFSFASWASRIPIIQQKLGLNEASLGLVLLSLPAGLMLSLPVSGWLVNQKGSKKILILAAVLYGCLLVTLGMANTILQLVIGLFCFGFVGNMCNISVNTQAVGVEALYKRNIMASFHGIWSLAGFSGAALGTVMSSMSVPPRTHFLIVLGVGLCIVVLAARFVLQHDVRSSEKQPVFVLPDRSLLVLGLIAFCSMMCEGAMFDWSGIYFKKVVHAKPSLVSAGYTAFMCTMAISRFVADFFTNRYGFKRIIQVSGLVIMSGLMLAVALPHFYTAIAGFLLVGAGVSSVVPLVYSAAGRSKKMSAGVALAAVSTISFFGFLFGPPVIGLLAAASSLRLSFAVIAFVGLCVTLLVTFARQEF